MKLIPLDGQVEVFGCDIVFFLHVSFLTLFYAIKKKTKKNPLVW